MMLDSLISQRISMLRTLLILSVVLLHTFGAPLATQIDFSDVPTLLRCIFIDRFGRFGVPTLSMVSGYLLFAAQLDLAPAKLFKKKLKTLIVPFLVFNVAYFGVQYGIECATGWAPLYHLTGKNAEDIAVALTGYIGFPINTPLHFLRDLFVLALLAPIFGLFIRNAPWIGLALVCGLFLTNLDGHLVNRDSMAALFYLGGMAAAGRWDLCRYDRFAVPAAIVLVAVCTIAVVDRVDSYTPIYLVSPPLVWIASSLLVGTRLGNWAIANSKYSFFVFLAHMPALRVSEVVRDRFDLNGSYLLTSTVVACIVLVTLALAYEAATRLMPNAFNTMIGARALKRPAAKAAPAFVDRRRTPRTAGAPVYSEALRATIVKAMNDVRLGADLPELETAGALPR